MDQSFRQVLEAVKRGESSVDEGLERLRGLAFEDLGFANVDHHRQLRRGFPEVVLAQGKTHDQVVAIVERLLAVEGDVLVTRADDRLRERLSSRFENADANDLARTVLWKRTDTAPRKGPVLVMSAGTSDMHAAEEACVTASALGEEVETLYDVGVAGIHRLLGHGDRVRSAAVLVVVAGMEGALPSVVAGLSDVPVIAVPTSTGYGASFGGTAALMAMLNSCASGVTVVNINNGFGAGYAASLINRLRHRETPTR